MKLLINEGFTSTTVEWASLVELVFEKVHSSLCLSW